MSARFYDVLNHAFYILFLLFCLVFYKERLFDMDAANYSWQILNNKDFYIPHDRYINYITQSPAVWLVQRDWPLKHVLLAYSATFALLFYLIYILFRYTVRSPLWSTFPLLGLLLSFRYKHFAGHTEIIVAIFLSSIFLAFVFSPNFTKIKSYLKWPVLLVLMIIISFTHPIMVAPLGMVLLGHICFTKNFFSRDVLLLILSLLVVFGLRFWAVMDNNYESGKISYISNIFNVIIHPDQYDSVKIIAKYMLTDYFPVLIFLAYILFKFLKSDRSLYVFYFLIANAALFIMIATMESYLRGNIYFLIDGYLGMFALLWAYPIIKYLQANDSKSIRQLLLALLLISASQIIQKSTFFRNRLNNFNKIVNAHPEHSKYYVSMDRYDWDEMWYPYFIPQEFMLLTALNGKDECKTLYVNFNGVDEKVFEKKNTFWLYSGSKSINELNGNYFKLPAEPYKKLTEVPW